MRKTFIALFVLAAVGLIQPTVASARGGGGGGHGGGFGGGGFRVAASVAAGSAEEDFADVGLEDMALGSTTADTILTRTTTTTTTAAVTWSVAA